MMSEPMIPEADLIADTIRRQPDEDLVFKLVVAGKYAQCEMKSVDQAIFHNHLYGVVSYNMPCSFGDMLARGARTWMLLICIPRYVSH